METKITTANVRIALSFNYSTFEISAQLENEAGVSIDDIKATREKCQLLAMEALNEYKILPSSNPKVELQRIENKIAAIKKMVETPVDPEKVAEIEKLPLYGESKADKKSTKKA